jgi:DNA-binding PadR family transcriptional regulator
MRTVNRLPKQLRYGAVLEQELSEKYGEMIDLAQVYVALQRLVDKGFITGQEAPTPTGYKHKVVVYSITPAGREALRHARSFYEMLAEPDPR